MLGSHRNMTTQSFRVTHSLCKQFKIHAGLWHRYFAFALVEIYVAPREHTPQINIELNFSCRNECTID